MKNTCVGGNRMTTSAATISLTQSSPCSSSSSFYYTNTVLSPSSTSNSRRSSASAASSSNGGGYANAKWFNSHCANATGRAHLATSVYPSSYNNQSPQRPRLSVADFRRTIVDDHQFSSTESTPKFSKPIHPFLSNAYRNDTIESSFSFDDLSPTEHDYYINHLSSNIYSSQYQQQQQQQQQHIDALLLLDDMHQRQLIVPAAVHGKSQSTPSSPKLLLHTQSAKDCLNNKHQTNTIMVPSPARKHSYDDRMMRHHEEECRTNNDNSTNLHLPNHASLGRNHSVGTLNIRRRLPQTPCEHETVKDKSLSCQPFDSDWSLPGGGPPLEAVDRKRNSIASSIPESTSSTSTTASSSKTSDDGIVIRPGTGRKLPIVPDFSREIKSQGYRKQWQQDERSSLERPCKTPPPSKCIQTACYTYPPELHNSRASSPYNRKYCQRRTSEQSIDQYVGVPCTCPTPPPCLTISEHFESKSSSDTEDHATVALSHDISDTENFPLNDQQFEIDPDDKSHGLGKLMFCIQYFPIRKRLRVSIIKATNLAGQLKPELELNTFIKICLEPGKVQKQRSARIVKGTRDAVYNEEYFFDNIGAQDMKTKSILIRICHNGLKQFQKDVVIGELDIPLLTLPTVTAKKEKRLCRELRPKLLKKLGRLHFTTLLEKDARRLTINILKVDNLPKYGISGPPDPCVRITVDQSGKVQTKQSRIMKATCHAGFKEAVMFLVSTRLSDLENTTIDICVHDMARTASGDDLIGHVTLGCHGQDRALVEQWRNTFMNHGKEIKGSYILKRDEPA